MIMMIQIKARADTGFILCICPRIRLRKFSIAAESAFGIELAALLLKIRSKNGESIAKDTIPKTTGRMIQRK